MERKIETYLYLGQLLELWRVDSKDLKRWSRDGLLPRLRANYQDLFHKDDIRNFEQKWSSELHRARVKKEVENLKRTQMAFEFSTLIHQCESPFGEDLPYPMEGVSHRKKHKKGTLPRI